MHHNCLVRHPENEDCPLGLVYCLSFCLLYDFCAYTLTSQLPVCLAETLEIN